VLKVHKVQQDQQALKVQPVLKGLLVLKVLLELKVHKVP
jgi:hypothetical protein